MEIKIVKIGDRVEVECSSGAPETEQLTYDVVVGMLMAALDGATNTFIEDLNDGQKSELYDRLDNVFGGFLKRVFPEIDPEEFTLIEAAIVKAQDEIINDAFERNISLEEALKEYEDKAKAYVEQRRADA